MGVSRAFPKLGSVGVAMIEDEIARPVTTSRELTRLVLHQMVTANRFGPKLGPAENHAMAQHILDLVVGTTQMTNADIKGSRT